MIGLTDKWLRGNQALLMLVGVAALEERRTTEEEKGTFRAFTVNSQLGTMCGVFLTFQWRWSWLVGLSRVRSVVSMTFLQALRYCNHRSALSAGKGDKEHINFVVIGLEWRGSMHQSLYLQ